MPFIPHKTDLPSFEEAFHGRHDCPGLESVYKNCILAAYAAATTEIQRMKLRVLGYLLIWPLNHASLSEVAMRVKRCFDGQSSQPPYERLDELGDFYIRHLIRPCAYAVCTVSGFMLTADEPIVKRHQKEDEVQEEESPEEADARMQVCRLRPFSCSCLRSS